MSLLNLMRQRRSRYKLTDQLPISQTQLEEILKECLMQTPSAFNSQTARLVLVTEEAHKKLWDLTAQVLRPLVPADAWEKTRLKVAFFSVAYGTILYFDDWAEVQKLQKQFPLYKEQFPMWAEQANGMLQFAVWSALAEAGIGASLQHYNPLIDSGVKQCFNIPEEWKLIAQMPFGIAEGSPETKTYLPIEQRLKVYVKAVK